MFSACMQAVLVANTLGKDGVTLNERKRQMLNPYAQQRVLKEWIMTPRVAQKFPEGLLDNFNDIEWIKKNSSGLYCPHSGISSRFYMDVKINLMEEEKELWQLKFQ